MDVTFDQNLETAGCHIRYPVAGGRIPLGPASRKSQGFPARFCTKPCVPVDGVDKRRPPEHARQTSPTCLQQRAQPDDALRGLGFQKGRFTGHAVGCRTDGLCVPAHNMAI